jgi:hypothetical protein
MDAELDFIDDEETFNDENFNFQPQLEKKSSLPDWLLEADTALNKFKVNYEHFQREHGALSRNIKEFDKKHKEARQEFLRRRYQIYHPSPKKTKKNNFDNLSNFILFQVAKFVSRDYGPVLMRLSRINKTLYLRLREGIVWSTMARDYFGIHFINQNQCNVAPFENKQREMLEKQEKQLEALKKMDIQNSKKSYGRSQTMGASKLEKPKSIVSGEENYWEVIFKDMYKKFLLCRETFKMLYNTRFPKNNHYDLLIADINQTFNFIIEIFSTVGVHEYNKNLRVLQVIRDLVMEERALLAILRQCHSENGVIRINAHTVLFLLIGYFPELKTNFMKYASHSAIQQIESNLKDYNMAVFTINMSPNHICVVPDIAGFKKFSKKIDASINKCCVRVNFDNNLPTFLPVYEKTVTWYGYFATAKGELIEEAEVNIQFDLANFTLEGNILTMKQIGEDDYESVLNKVQGKYYNKSIEKRLEAMNGDNALKSYRDKFADILVTRENNKREDYTLYIDFALSTEKDGWLCCLHGVGIGNIIFYCYTKFKSLSKP